MNIFVVATALQAGGGITIYKQFLSHLPKYIGEDKYWIFVNPILPKVKIEGVTYVISPLQSKVKRILSEGKFLVSEIERMKVNLDIIISLQNNGFKELKNYKQIVYYHQSLPLYPGFWNPFKEEERSLFLYKNIFPHIVRRTWVKETQFVVQTQFIKRRMIEYYGILEQNIHQCFPDVEKIDLGSVKPYQFEKGITHFVCVVVGDVPRYKNLVTLIQAAKIYKRKYIDKFGQIRIHLTTTVEEAHVWANMVKHIGVEDVFQFDGAYKHDDLMELYKGADGLLFPSSIETLGLPLLEAAAFGIPVLAADVDYAHEVMREYEGAIFTGIHDYEIWAENMKNVVENKRRFTPLVQNRKSDWGVFFELLK